MLVMVWAVATVARAADTPPVLAMGFDEAGGSTAHDASPHHNDGAVEGATWTAEGRFGRALSFDGQQAWVTVPDSPSLDLTTSGTLEAWVNPRSIPAPRDDCQTLFGKEKAPWDWAYGLYAWCGDASGWLNDVWLDGPVLPTGQWSHVALTWTGTDSRLYVNGSEVASDPLTVPDVQVSNGPLRIGGNSIWGEYFDGLIDEVRIYDRALTATELNTDANTATVDMDMTAPDVHVTSPDDGETVSGTVDVRTEADDDHSVGQVQVLVDGHLMGPALTEAPYVTSWNSRFLADGDHVITAIARDATGKETTSSPVHVTVDNSASAGPVAALGFDEALGDPLLDASGQGISGSLGGAERSDDGEAGRALAFDAQTAAATIPAAAVPDMQSGFSVEGWVNPSSVDLPGRIAGQDGSGGAGFSIDVGSGPQSALRATIGGVELDGPTLPTDEWTHVALVFDGSSASLYADGVRVGTAADVTVTNSQSPILVGADAADPTRHFIGRIDELRFYPRALSVDEIDDDRDDPVVADPAPVLALSGAAVTHQDDWITTDDESLAVDARPGDVAAPGSALRSIELRIDDQAVDRSDQDCGQAGCDEHAEFVIHPSQLEEGRHDVTVVATDQLGRQSDETIRVHIDHGPPGAVDRVEAADEGGHVDVSWEGLSIADLRGYDILRADDPAGPFVQRNTDPVTGVEYRDPDVQDGHSYTYEVRAVDEAGTSGSASAPVTVSVGSARPAAPAGVEATSGSSTISVSWTADDLAATGGGGYHVYRSSQAGGPYQRLTSRFLTADGYSDDDVAPGMTYFYVVRRVDDSGMLSPASAEVTAAAYASGSDVKPRLALSGALVDHRDQFLAAGNYGLHVDASESSAAGPTPGLGDVEILVDGISADHVSQPCEEGDCSLSRDFTFATGDYDEGAHLVEVVATDRQDNTTVSAFDVRIDRGAPAAPTGLVGEPQRKGSVLRWAGNSELDVSGYLVFRADASGGPYRQITPQPVSQPAYTDTGLVNGNTYYYVVRAIDDSDQQSPDSDEVAVTPDTASAHPPTGLHASVDLDTIKVSWNAVTSPDLLGYHVYRRVSGTTQFTELSTKAVAALGYTDKTPIPGVTYDYAVSTESSAGARSAMSAVTSAAVSDDPDGEPTSPGPFVYAKPSSQSRNSDLVLDDGQGNSLGSICGGCLVGSDDARPALSPDGSLVAYVSTATTDASTVESIVVARTDGTESHVLCDDSGVGTPCGAQSPDMAVGFSSDGQHVLYADDGDIDSIKLDGTDRSTIVPGDGRWFTEPAISADGSTLYFVQMATSWWSNSNDSVAVWRANSDGSAAHTLATFGAVDPRRPRPSPDGLTVAFDAQDINFHEEIFTVPATGGAAQQITTAQTAWSDYGPTWSPDGRRILFDHAGPTGISSLNPTGSGRQDLLHGSYYQASYRQPAQPQVAVEGGLPPTVYSGGVDPASVHVSASDEVTGISKVALVADGVRDVHTNSCSPSCPPDWTGTLTVPTATLDEGTHRAVLLTRSGQDSQVRLTYALVVDRTAPPASTLSAAMSNDGQNVLLSVVRHEDPKLPDGSPGSGLAAVEYRYQTPDGSWGAWTATTGPTFSLRAADMSLTAPIQTRSTDRAGNRSTVESVTPVPAHWWCPAGATPSIVCPDPPPEEDEYDGVGEIERLGKDKRKKKEWACNEETKEEWKEARGERSEERNCEETRWTAVYEIVEAGVVQYVGITGDPARRCGEHVTAAKYSGTFVCLIDVPYLGVALSVEDTLMEVYGFRRARKNVNLDTKQLQTVGRTSRQRPTLLNLRRNVTPVINGLYCTHIRLGEGILVAVPITLRRVPGLWWDRNFPARECKDFVA